MIFHLKTGSCDLRFLQEFDKLLIFWRPCCCHLIFCHQSIKELEKWKKKLVPLVTCEPRKWNDQEFTEAWHSGDTEQTNKGISNYFPPLQLNQTLHLGQCMHFAVSHPCCPLLSSTSAQLPMMTFACNPINIHNNIPSRLSQIYCSFLCIKKQETNLAFAEAAAHQWVDLPTQTSSKTIQKHTAFSGTFTWNCLLRVMWSCFSYFWRVGPSPTASLLYTVNAACTASSCTSCRNTCSALQLVKALSVLVRTLLSITPIAVAFCYNGFVRHQISTSSKGVCLLKDWV